MTKKPHIVIISGVTGSIGNACFEQYILDNKTLVFGLSRKGSIAKKLPDHHFISKLDFSDQKAVSRFAQEVFSLKPKTITYIHCIGEFKTELNPKNLKKKIHNDSDRDGIDDETHAHIYDYTMSMVQALIEQRTHNSIKINVVSLGSLVEDYHLELFHSWTEARKKLLSSLKEAIKENNNISVYNILISTLLSAKELIARPYVFGTDANPKFWLKAPYLAARIKAELGKNKTGFHTKRFFHRIPKFAATRFTNKEMKVRRLYELYGIASK